MWLRVALLAGVLGCKSDPPANVVSGSGSAPSKATSINSTSHDDQLAFEAAHRPTTSTLTPEALFEALAKASITVDAKQTSAKAAQAAYCSGGPASNGVAVMVCEYGSPYAAYTARDKVIVANGTSYLHGTTIVTLSGGDAAAQVAIVKILDEVSPPS